MLADPRPLPLSLELEPELELRLLSSPELFEVAVVPVLPPECLAETTATEIPVAPTPSTAVAIAAAEARCSQRLGVEWESSVVTMP
ncbi:hypothetical protein [Kribbella sp. NPDC004875]|uniref:hypothetical protein n=1 Tax=Kribbella sp. NPDC004875 TaxID=3364107 RepID=UPI0036CF2097